METTSDDKNFLHIKVLRILIRRGWRMYFPTRRYFGFHVVDVLPKGKIISRTHNSEYILKPILALHRKSERYRLIIRADNAGSHRAWRSQTFYDLHSLRMVFIIKIEREIHNMDVTDGRTRAALRLEHGPEIQSGS
jgi:hypothetical protein